MNTYFEALWQYMREHPLELYGEHVESVIDLFYDCYAEGALRDTPAMRQGIHRLYELTSPGVGDQLLDVLSGYSLEVEKRAFRVMSLS